LVRTSKALEAVTIVTTILLQLLIKQQKPIYDTAVNEKVVQSRSFIVNSVSTNLNTSAKGTVFIKGKEGRTEQIQIVASIEIDPIDWGGVAFYIPDQWYSNIISSYPENKTQSKHVDYVATWTTAAETEVGTDSIVIPISLTNSE